MEQFGPYCEEAVGICRLLIDSGADMTCRDREGNTPLHWAARAGHSGVVGLLVVRNCLLGECYINDFVFEKHHINDKVLYVSNFWLFIKLTVGFYKLL